LSDAPIIYHVPPDTQLDWRSWDDETIVYHRASGDCHLLNAVSAEALRSLQQSPGSVDDVTERVGEALGLPIDEALAQQMQQLLVQFDELGLIEPIHGP